jgi:hypothetical protein
VTREPLFGVRRARHGGAPSSVELDARRRDVHGGALIPSFLSEFTVHVERRQEPDPEVPVLHVVPVEDHLAVAARMLGRAESPGEVGSVLLRLELRLGVGVVARDVRP